MSIFLINLAIKGSIDIGINPILMRDYGFLISILTTTTIYFIVGIVSVLIYDYYGNDFLMIESLKESYFTGEEIKTTNKVTRLIAKNSKYSKFFLGLFLAIKNPGLMVVYMRKGFYLYNGFAGREVKLLLLLNLLIINMYWNIMMYFGVSIWDLLF